MDEKLIERAVEAAAKADYEVLYSNPDRRSPWEEQSDDFRDAFRSDVRPLVTAALAEVNKGVTEVIRAVLEQAWDEGAHATEQHYKQTVLGHPGPVFSTVNPYRKGGKS